MKLDIIAGARPNFMKIAAVIKAIREQNEILKSIEIRLVHTGQHFDDLMSGSFFSQLGIPQPDINLEAGGGSQAEQTAAIMIRYEKVLLQDRPDAVLVVGDVTSTMACTITAKKIKNIPVIHIEGGIRSGDLSMPEEVNRIVTDALADYFFTTSLSANENLFKSGAPKENVFFVGNTMIDTLISQIPNFRKPPIWDTAQLAEKEYVVITLHRPTNVDQPQTLITLIDAIVDAAASTKLIFPVHPRTAKSIASLGIVAPNLYLIDPLGYLEFNYLVKNAKAVITDSGGITEETTVMGIPCMTLRETTERPETCNVGTNLLLGTNAEAIKPAFEQLLAGKWKAGTIPELWDGHAAERIVTILNSLFCN